MPEVSSRFALYDRVADLKARRALPWQELPGKKLVDGPTREEYERVRSYLRASRAITEERTRLLDSVFSFEHDPRETIRPLERRRIEIVERVWNDLFTTHLQNSTRLAEAFQAAAVAGQLPSSSLLPLVQKIVEARGIAPVTALSSAKASRRNGAARNGSTRTRARRGDEAEGSVDDAMGGQILLGRSILTIHHVVTRLFEHGQDNAAVRDGTGQNHRVLFHACSTPIRKFYVRYGYSRSRHETWLEGPSSKVEDVIGLCYGMNQTGLRVRMLERFVADGEEQWNQGEACIELGPKEIASLSRELEAIDAPAWNALRIHAEGRVELESWEEFLRGMWSLLPRAAASGKVLHVYWTTVKESHRMRPVHA